MNTIIYKKDGIEVNGEFLSKSDIDTKCCEAAVKEDNLVLLTMEWCGWRGFDGILEKIVVTNEELEVIKRTIVGKIIDFGEIAGKHSEVEGELEEGNIEVTSDIKQIVGFLRNYPTGHEYNHSFLQTYFEHYQDNVEEGDSDYNSISQEDLKILNRLAYK